MESKNIILIAIIVLVLALFAVLAFSMTNDNTSVDLNATNTTNTTTATNITKNVTTNNTTKNETNQTTINLVKITPNKTYKVYDPQSDSYVQVIGEKFDEEVGRWYTYDKDNVRYYNTRIRR